ncbi:MAG: transcription termination/antitermination protein NusG [Armatimonadetes bacterium]|nr:transcription termination/antitermination protein NusG [Armatimonadota bacterium]MDW8122856.1 transcription termination/antitermination protein NusG [Armatimonadota bacterium]
MASAAQPTVRMRWYAVHVMTGQEEKVQRLLEKRVKAAAMGHKIGRIIIPKEKEATSRRRGPTERRVFPGYILVEMHLDEDTWYLVRRTPGVTGFVGAQVTGSSRKSLPLVEPLRDQEVEGIVRLSGQEVPRQRPIWHKGESVRIKFGPFQDAVGRIDQVNSQKQTLVVLLNLMGRETPVEVDSSQVERL